MPTKRNLLLMGLTAWSLLISPLRVNAQTEVQILDKRCTDVYEENAKFFLQFLYKIDGNLQNLNPSKLKRLPYLEEVYRNRELTDGARKSAFGELYNDGDWWQFQLQRKASELIKTTETLLKDQSWTHFKGLVEQQTKAGAPRQDWWRPSPTSSILETVELYGSTVDFFEIFEEVSVNLDRLGESSRIKKALPEDPYVLGFEKAFVKTIPKRILQCQIEYMGLKLSKAQS